MRQLNALKLRSEFSRHFQKDEYGLGAVCWYLEQELSSVKRFD